MTTVKELIHALTADYVDPDDEVVVTGEEYDWTTNFEVVAINGQVRIAST